MTAKTPLKVHLRLRFQNLGKPRTAGLCGRAADACDCGPLSCTKIERPSLLEKPPCKVRFFANRYSRKYRQKVTVTTLFQTTSHRTFSTSHTNAPRSLSRVKAGTHSAFGERSHTRAHTAKQGHSLPRPQCGFALPVNSFLFRHAFIYIHFPVHCEPPLSAERKIRRNCRHKLYPQPFLIPVFNFSHKRPTFAFTPESGYTLAFAQRIAHEGTHVETGGVSGGVVSLPSERSARSPTSPGRVSERRTLPFFGSWPGALPKNAESLRNSDAHDACRCSEGVAAPLGCVIFFRFCQNNGLYALFQILFSVLQTLQLVLFLCKLRLGSFLVGSELFKGFRFCHCA